MTPARPDVPASEDFSLHFFGIPDREVIAFWKFLESLPRDTWRRHPCEMDEGTRVRITNGMDAGIEGVVSKVYGEFRYVTKGNFWYRVPMRFLEEIA